jgi:hypothetical protein
MNASGNAVQPTSQDDAVALEKAILYADLTQNLENVFTNPLPTAYPISAYSYFVTPCSPSLAAAQGSSCAGNNSGSSSFPSQKGQALGQFVQFVACAGQQQMADLGYSPLPPNLVQEDFDAIGRLNGGQEPPPVSSATCKNPYVDGQTPLPGEPAVIGSATAPVVGAGTAPGKSTGPGPGSAGTAVGGSNNSGGGAGGQVGLGSTVSTTQIGGAAQLSAIQAADAAKKTRQVNAIRAQFSNADALATTAARLLGTTSAAGAIALWCTVLLVVLAAPVIGSLMWRRRRRRGAGGSPAHPRSVLAIQAGGKGNGP